MTEGLRLAPLFRRIGEVAPYLDRGYAVLTPNRRLSRAVRAADALRREAGGEGAWNTPLITPERQFWTDLWQRGVLQDHFAPRRVLDVPSQRLVWERVIENDRRAGFSLLSARRAAALCQTAHERLLLWRVEPEQARWRSWFNLDDDSATFRRWLAAYEGELAALQASTPEQAHRELLAYLEEPASPKLPVPPVVRLLCDDTAPLHRALAEAAPDVAEIDLPPLRTRPQEVQAFADAEGELEAAARWCRERFEEAPGGRYAVVLQDMDGERAVFETLLRRAFGCLTTDYDSLPVNFATGFTLDQPPLIRDALRALALGSREVDVEESLALLSSRFVAAGDFPPALLERQARKLRDLAARRVPTGLLRETLAPLAGTDKLAAPWNAALVLESRGLRLQRRALPSAWVDAFRALLEAWSWGVGVALDSLEYQQRVAWEEALDAFAGLDGVLPSLDFEEALGALQRFLRERPFQPQTADRSIQVLGPLETTGLGFEGLWVTGMSAAAWPARARANPYLPGGLQTSLGMPGADARVARAEAMRRWDHWQSCTTSLVTSFQFMNDEAEQIVSPLLEGVLQHRRGAPVAPEPRWIAAANAEAIPVPLSNVALQGHERAGVGVGSSVLESQALCPFRAFASARLNAAPAPEAASGLLPTERGTLLHRALQRVFTELPDRSHLLRVDEAGLDKLLGAAIGEARGGLSRARRLVLGAGALDLEERRLKGLLQGWIDLERKRETDFTAIDLEVERSLVLEGLPLRLRIDRIDRLEDGSELVIDYKTGRVESLGLWFSDPPLRTQMPLYALAEPGAAGVSHAVIRPGEYAWRGVGTRDLVQGMVPATEWVEDAGEGDPENSFESVRRAWRERLESLARAFVEGQSRVEPVEGACRLCQRHALCRIGDGAA